MSTSNVCPELVQYRKFIVGRVLWLEKLWTNIVQELVHGLVLDRTLTRFWQTLCLSANWTKIGQRFDRDWTNIGFHVQSLSNWLISTEFVKTLSKSCQERVHAQALGQRLDMKIQYLSTACPIINKTLPTINSRYWTNSGQTLDVDNLWTQLWFVVFLDKILDKF